MDSEAEVGKDKCAGSRKVMDEKKKMTEGQEPITKVGDHWTVQLHIQEDNNAAISSVRSGKNESMTTTEKNHGVSLGWTHAQLGKGMYHSPNGHPSHARRSTH